MRILISLLLILPVGLQEAAFSHGDSGVFVQAPDFNWPSSFQINTSKLSVQALPEPTGPYRVGTAIFHLTDTSRPDTLSKKPGQFRELMLQVWYPSERAPKGEAAPYIPNPALLQALNEEQHDGQDPSVFATWKDLRTE